MATTLWKTPTYVLAAICLFSALSRFTHGQYTKSYYAWQEYHALDDGSLIGQITPIADMTLGILVLYPKTRLGASVVVEAFFLMGLLIQIKARKDYGLDVVLFAVGALAALAAYRTVPVRAERLLMDRTGLKRA